MNELLLIALWAILVILAEELAKSLLGPKLGNPRLVQFVGIVVGLYFGRELAAGILSAVGVGGGAGSLGHLIRQLPVIGPLLCQTLPQICR